MIRIQEYVFNRKNLPRRADFLKQQQTRTSKTDELLSEEDNFTTR